VPTHSTGSRRRRNRATAAELSAGKHGELVRSPISCREVEEPVERTGHRSVCSCCSPRSNLTLPHSRFPYFSSTCCRLELSRSDPKLPFIPQPELRVVHPRCLLLGLISDKLDDLRVLQQPGYGEELLT
jgi:hypothetical protein